MKRRAKGKGSTSVINSLRHATSPAELQYMMNGRRYLARNPGVPAPYGSTPCEGFHGESKEFFRQVVQQREEHARVLARLLTVRKLIDGAMARVPMSTVKTKGLLLQMTAGLFTGM